MCIWLVSLSMVFLGSGEDITSSLPRKYNNTGTLVGESYYISVILANVPWDNYVKCVPFSLPLCRWAVRVYPEQILEKEEEKETEWISHFFVFGLVQRDKLSLPGVDGWIAEQRKMDWWVGWAKIWENTLRRGREGARCGDWKGWALRSVRWKLSRLLGWLIMRLTWPSLEYS